MAKNFLHVSGITKSMGENLVLDGISFDQLPFQNLALAGQTGSGKTTLMKAIAGLVQPDAGSIFFEDQRILGPEEKLLPGHEGIGYLSQHFELRHNYRVEEILEYANQLNRQDMDLLIQLCQVDHLLKRKTDQLSGGERQRIALARLLLSAPRLLLLDEPFSNLDQEHRMTLKKVLHDIGEQLQMSFILVSHDPEDVLSWADVVLVLKEGKLRQNAAPEQIYRKPADLYTAHLMGRCNVLDAETARELFQLGIPPQKLALIRPEGFHPANGDTERIPFQVKRSRFLGHHYEWEVTAKGQVLFVWSESAANIGETVFLRPDPSAVWLVNRE